MGECSIRHREKTLPVITWENISPPYKDYTYFENAEGFPFRPDAETFSIVNAWWLIEASTLVYADEVFARSHFQKAGLEEVECFSEKGTECFVASNEHLAIVAFRGTEIRRRFRESGIEDILIDLKTDFKISLVDSGLGGKVHEGFNEALDRVWEKKGLRSYMKGLQKNRRKLWVTGHSLGAALATLLAFRYLDVQGLYTFGSPRVGDADFKRHFQIRSRNYRFIHHSDIVTRVPPALVYRHVGEPIYIDGKGKVHRHWGGKQEEAKDMVTKIRQSFDSLDRISEGLSGLIPQPFVDHVPTLYAIHIWNSIPDWRASPTGP